MSSIFLKNKNYNIAFITTFFVGIFTHLYAMVNPIFNDDAIKMRNVGMNPDGGSSGRWLAEIISDIAVKMGYTITVPFFAYLLCIILMSFVSSLLIKIFRIRNVIIVIIISSLVITSTSIIQIFSYDYVSPNLILSILVSMLSCFMIYDISINNLKNNCFVLKTIIGILLFAFATGIYQISIPIFFSILIMDLIINFIFKNQKNIEVIKKGLYYIFVAICGILIYILLNKLVNIYVYNREFIGGHYGMTANVIPRYSLYLIKDLIIKCIAIPIVLPFINYAGINTTLYSKILVLLIYILFIVLYIYCIRQKTIKNKIFSLFLLLLFIISVNLQRVIVTQSIQTRMTFSLVFIFILPLLFLDNIDDLFSFKIRNISIVLYILLILHLIFVSSANYYTAHIKNLSIRNLCNQIVSKIINADGYNQKLPVAFIGGSINNLNFYRYDYNENNLSDQYIFNPDYLFDAEAIDSMFKVFANFKYISPEVLTIDNESQIPIDKDVYYKYGHYGYTYSTNNEILNMPCYPDDGCVKVIDGVVVVKISN